MTRLRLLLPLALALVCVAACRQTPNPPPELATQLSASSAYIAEDVALDRAGGGVYLAGLSFEPSDPEGDSYAFLARYSRTGSLLWKRAFGTPRNDRADAVAVGPQGEAYVLWSEFTNNGFFGYDYTLSKYSRSGHLLWERRVSASPLIPSDVAVDTSGNIYVVGVDVIEGHEKPFVRKYAPSGRVLWQRKPNLSQPRSVAVSSTDNVYIAGWGSGAEDNRLSKLSRSGELIWTRKLGVGTGVDARVAVYGSDTIYTAFNRVLDDESVPILGAGTDLSVSSYSSLGQVRWTRETRLDYSTHLVGLDVSPNGTLFVTGNVIGLETSENGTVIERSFTRKYSRTGTSLFTELFAVHPNFTRTQGVAAWSGGELYIVGGAAETGTNSRAFIRRLDGRGREVWTDW